MKIMKFKKITDFSERENFLEKRITEEEYFLPSPHS